MKTSPSRVAAGRPTALLLAIGLGAAAVQAPAQTQLTDLNYELIIEAQDRDELNRLGTPIVADSGQADPNDHGALTRFLTFASYPYSGFGTPGVGAMVRNWGNTFAVQANTPWRTSPAAAGDVSYTYADVLVRESFRKESADARMFFTYTLGELDLFRDPEFSNGSPEYMQASLGWWVGVFRNDDFDTPVWADSQAAVAYTTENNTWALDAGRWQFDDPRLASPFDFPNGNPDWRWSCSGCDRRAVGLLSGTLQAPFRGEVDLSAIPFDPLLPLNQQVEFTVVHLLIADADDTGAFSFAAASAQDPLSQSGTVAIEVQGLFETNNPVALPLSPVPEAPTALMLALGVFTLAWRQRARVAGMALIGAWSALACHPAAATVAIGQPVYYIEFVEYIRGQDEPRQVPPETFIVPPAERWGIGVLQYGGEPWMLHLLGRDIQGLPAFLQAGATNGGRTFWAGAATPFRGGPNRDVEGGGAFLNLSQSYVKDSEDATLTYTFNVGSMYLMNYGGSGAGTLSATASFDSGAALRAWHAARSALERLAKCRFVPGRGEPGQPPG